MASFSSLNLCFHVETLSLLVVLFFLFFLGLHLFSFFLFLDFFFKFFFLIFDIIFLDGVGEDIAIVSRIFHPNWDITTLNSDICLLKLARPATPSRYIGQACHPDCPSQVRISAWGASPQCSLRGGRSHCEYSSNKVIKY